MCNYKTFNIDFFPPNSVPPVPFLSFVFSMWPSLFISKILFRNVFTEFGDDVKKFITLNEPKETSIQGNNVIKDIRIINE